jgi:hypothetical protein
MVLTLNPRYPLVWRTPSSLQLGVANPVVILTDVSVAAERMLAALAVGVSEPGLVMIGRAAGADVAEISTLIADLAPALNAVTAPPAGAATGQAVGRATSGITGGAESPTVLLVGTGLDGPTLMLDQLAAVLAAANVRVRIATNASTVMAHDRTGSANDADASNATDCDLAIAISHYVLAPALRGVWLRRDLPHLTVNFSDTRVELGPIIEPGRGPCLYCIERHRTDADEAWPAIISQLWGRRSALESPAIVGEVVAVVARMAIRRLTEEPTPPSFSTLELDALTGERSNRAWSIHRECGCTGLVAAESR